MAGGAGVGHDAKMSKGRAHPGGGAMAAVARLVGDWMIRRLARGDAVVMALRALTGHYADMGEPRHLPRGRRGMALTARLLCRYVIGGFEGNALNATAGRVAGLALLGCAFEGALDMASFAGKRDVRPGQREARFDVIEIHVASCFGRLRVAVKDSKQNKTEQGEAANPGRKPPEMLGQILHGWSPRWAVQFAGDIPLIPARIFLNELVT